MSASVTATAFVMATLVRVLTLVATAVVMGVLALDRFVLPDLDEQPAAARARLRAWTIGAVVVLIATTGAELLLRTQTMTGRPLTSALSAVPAVLTHTHYGGVALVRAVALVLLLVLAAAFSRTARAVALPVAAVVALTTSLGGHAADWGDLGLAVAADWIHIVAASIWTGGLFALAVVVLRAFPPWPLALVTTIAARFSRLAGGCALAVVATGAYNTWLQVRAPSALVTTGYGRVLVAKVVMAGAVIGLGAINRYAIVGRLVEAPPPRWGAGAVRWMRLLFGGGTESSPRLTSRLTAYVTAEALLAVVIFGLTAVLGDSTPARHARRHEHGAAATGVEPSDTERALGPHPAAHASSTDAATEVSGSVPAPSRRAQQPRPGR
jgi:putative copper export protein